MLNRNLKKDGVFNRSYERIPAFQLNKFQSEFNLSFNKEFAKILSDALERHEEMIQNSGKSVPTCLFALLSKLEDAQKPRNYDDRAYEGGDFEQNHNQNPNDSYEYR
jgi:hypothetical protein